MSWVEISRNIPGAWEDIRGMGGIGYIGCHECHRFHECHGFHKCHGFVLDGYPECHEWKFLRKFLGHGRTLGGMASLIG